MKFYNSKTKELDDNAILEALEEAKQDYENGAIVECKSILNKISRAITKFEQEYE